MYLTALGLEARIYPYLSPISIFHSELQTYFKGLILHRALTPTCHFAEWMASKILGDRLMNGFAYNDPRQIYEFPPSRRMYK